MNESIIEGTPTIDGRLVTGADLPPVAQDAIDQWISLGRRIRGQFAIIARSPDASVGLTDLTGAYPVFHSGTRLEPRLEAWTSGGARSLSAEGVCRFAAFGTVSAGCSLVREVRPLLGASVGIVDQTGMRTRPWFDWKEGTQPNLSPEKELQEEFKAIVAGWAAATLPPTGRIGLLLSGGTDSTLLASLLKPLLGERLICITQDFFLDRYTERTDAMATAAFLKLPLLTAPITRRAYYEAFVRLNGASQDVVVHSSQTQNLYCLAAFARDQGIDTLVSGEHADSLFLGFGHFFRGFPTVAREYQALMASLSPEQKVGYVVGQPPNLSPLAEELLSSLGVQPAECRSLVNELFESRRRCFAPLAESVPLPTLQQLGGQIDGGAAWREIGLAVMRAIPGCRVLCPFFDSEIIRFALRLPLEWHFQEGQTKYFLRRLLKTTTGMERPKRPAARSPLRFWRFLPNLGEYRAVSPQLRPLYRKLQARNSMARGGLYNEMAMIAGLGIWVESHRLSGPAS